MTNAMVCSAISAIRFFDLKSGPEILIFWKILIFPSKSLKNKLYRYFSFTKKDFELNLEKMLRIVAFWKKHSKGGKKRKLDFLYKITFSKHIQLKQSTLW